MSGPRRIRTFEGARPADLQSAPVDRFGIDPLKEACYETSLFIIKKIWKIVKRPADPLRQTHAGISFIATRYSRQIGLERRK